MQNLFEQVDALNNDDFEALINHIDKQKKKRARDILAEAQRQASRFLADTEVKSSVLRGPREPKYRNPNNHQQTWSGMGRQPQWFREYLENGGSEEDMLI